MRLWSPRWDLQGAETHGCCFTFPTLTVLLVDDNEEGRVALARLLQENGFAVREAADGHDALRQVSGEPDLVVLDVVLPDLDGYEVCRRIKADPTPRAFRS